MQIAADFNGEIKMSNSDFLVQNVSGPGARVAVIFKNGKEVAHLCSTWSLSKSYEVFWDCDEFDLGRKAERCNSNQEAVRILEAAGV